METTDRSLECTALREAEEEIGIDHAKVELLGRLEELPSISGYVITPVVGHLHWPTKLKLNVGEVSRVFSIPMAWLAVRDHYGHRLFHASNGREDYITFYQPYDGEQLWGISARITLQLLEALGLLTHRSA